MADDLNTLETKLGGLLAKLGTGERKALAASIARELRKSQRMRIKAQRNPDGSAFEPRRAKKTETTKPVRFLYKKPGGSERLVDMGSWAQQGRLMTGFDREAGGIRSFRKDRVSRFLQPGRSGARIRDKAGHIKRKAMFKKLPGRLKAKADANGVTLGFYGRIGALARTHQFGLRERPHGAGRDVQYPARQLLGFTEADHQMIEAMILDHLAGWRE